MIVWALDVYVCSQKLVWVPVPACYLLRYLCHCWSLVIAMGGLEQGRHSVSQSQGESPSSKGTYLSFVGLLPGPLGTVSQERKLQTDTEFLGPRKMAIHPMEQTLFKASRSVPPFPRISFAETKGHSSLLSLLPR